MIIAVDFDGTIVTFAVNENHTGEITHTANGYRIACHKLNTDIYIDDHNIGGFHGGEAICHMLTDRMNYSRHYAYLTKAPTQLSGRAS